MRPDWRDFAYFFDKLFSSHSFYQGQLIHFWRFFEYMYELSAADQGQMIYKRLCLIDFLDFRQIQFAGFSSTRAMIMIYLILPDPYDFSQSFFR